MSKQAKIAKTALSVSMVSVATLLLSFVKESIFAYYYGASVQTDAYTVAIHIPTTLFSLFSTAISNVVLPYYSKIKEKESSTQAGNYISNIMTLVTALSLSLVLVLELFAPAVMKLFAPGLQNEASKTAVLLFRMVLPTIILTELMNINSAVLNVNKSFVLPSLGSALLNAVFVLVVVFGASQYGIYAAVWATIVGTIIQFLYSVLLRRRFLKYRWVCDIEDHDMHESLRKMVPVFIGIGVAEVNKLVDTLVSSFLKTGSISMLNYASKLTSAISMLLINSITTVVYPEFAQSAALRDDKRMADSFLFSLKMVCMMLLPIFAGGAVLSKEIITIVYRRGAFQEAAVNGTAPIFVAYLVGLIFVAIRQIASRVFYSYGDTKTPMKNSLVGIIINIILNITVVRFLGAVGLALATAASNAVICLLLLRQLHMRNAEIAFQGFEIFILKVFFASGGMAAVLFFMKSLTIRIGLYCSSHFAVTCVFAILSVMIGSVLYFLTLLLLRTDEAVAIVKSVLRRRK